MKKQTFSSTQTKVKVVTATMLIGGGIAVAAAAGYIGFSYFKTGKLNFDRKQFYKPFVSGNTAGYNPGYTPGYNAGYVPGYSVKSK
ncbi:hypothetical protein KKG46_02520 [Patescibacteria group bacterium]|nr:hypothetical protein [Patescibacteria group bacterium]